MPVARREFTLVCASPDCGEWSLHAADTKAEELRRRQKPWYCTRHTRPEQVLTPTNTVRERVLEVYELPFGKFWREAGTEESGSDFTHGPGFKAFADDFPVGTRLIVTARLETEVALAGNYTCGCGAVVAFEGEIPADCLRCGSTLHTFNPGGLSDEEVQALFWVLKNEAKLRGISTTTHPWPPRKATS